MRLHRFYVVQPLGEEVVIDDVSKINQWSKVFRYKTNDSVILFNGDGFDVEYTISSLSIKHCTLTRVRKTPSFIPSKKISLFLSLIKKDIFELVVQKATELGVTTVTPLISLRSLQKNLNHSRLHTIAIEASEQCGRGDVPQILEPISLSEYINNLSTNTLCIVFEKDGLLPNTQTLKALLHSSREICLFVGPEGGWDERELDQFRKNNATFVSLGETTLRAETAAIIGSFLVSV